MVMVWRAASASGQHPPHHRDGGYGSPPSRGRQSRSILRPLSPSSPRTRGPITTDGYGLARCFSKWPTSSASPRRRLWVPAFAGTTEQINSPPSLPVVPANAGTHNHRWLWSGALLQQVANILRITETEAMGPRLRGDDRADQFSALSPRRPRERGDP